MAEQQSGVPAKEATDNIPSSKKPRNIRPWIALIILILLALGAGGWYTWQFRIPPGWAEHRSEKFGLRFIYPKSWGNPTVVESEASVFPAAKQEGKSYDITFSNAQKAERIFLITFQSNDSKVTICSETNPNQCVVNKALTQSDVKARSKGTKANKDAVVFSDSTSFATVANSQPGYKDKNQTHKLSLAQVVDLPKINVSAISAEYTLANSTTCPKDKLAPDKSAGCITQSIYNDIKRVAKSFQGI